MDRWAIARRYSRISVRPYPATARWTRSRSMRYRFAAGCMTPVAPCRNVAFCFPISRCRPCRKVQRVGWWHWNSDCRPLCHPSTVFVVRAIPSTAASCLFHVSMGDKAEPYTFARPRRLRPRTWCARRTWWARPDRHTGALILWEDQMLRRHHHWVQRLVPEDNGCTYERHRRFRTGTSGRRCWFCEGCFGIDGSSICWQWRLDMLEKTRLLQLVVVRSQPVDGHFCGQLTREQFPPEQ